MHLPYAEAWTEQVAVEWKARRPRGVFAVVVGVLMAVEGKRFVDRLQPGRIILSIFVLVHEKSESAFRLAAAP